MEVSETQKRVEDRSRVPIMFPIHDFSWIVTISHVPGIYYYASRMQTLMSTPFIAL